MMVIWTRVMAMGGGENLSDSRYTLKIEPRRFAHRLDLYCERMRGVKDDS